MSQALRFSGIMPANLLPFTADLEIDEAAYRRPGEARRCSGCSAPTSRGAASEYTNSVNTTGRPFARKSATSSPFWFVTLTS